MTSVEIGKCLGYLKAYYSNWNLDITNAFVLDVWFQALRKLDYQTFKNLIKQYCKDNKYPPSSPSEFLLMIPRTYTVEEAWSIVLEIISRASEKAIALNMLSKYPVIYNIMIPLMDISIEEDTHKNKCYGYLIGKYFKKDYQKYLDTLAVRYEGNLLVSNNQPLLANEEKKYIE